MIMATTLEEERGQLTAIIEHWNSARPDLFAITLPNEVSLLGAECNLLDWRVIDSAFCVLTNTLQCPIGSV